MEQTPILDTPRDDVKKSHDVLAALLEDADAGNDVIRDAALNLTAALAEFWDHEELLGSNPRTDGRRDWWSGGVWLYPGDEVVVLRARQPGVEP